MSEKDKMEENRKLYFTFHSAENKREENKWIGFPKFICR